MVNAQCRKNVYKNTITYSSLLSYVFPRETNKSKETRCIKKTHTHTRRSLNTLQAIAKTMGHVFVKLNNSIRKKFKNNNEITNKVERVVFFLSSRHPHNKKKKKNSKENTKKELLDVGVFFTLTMLTFIL